ncbi:MAG: 2-aminoethylphosphonate--pyruvate transaminase [Oscillospiraceae bacterium]|jgi:2-aminoethylphosphonate-pyruvate transaminase|nr:2-aminoethylphosphonate--pyruvate transaminase [Oscillospiraceae bacterium]
MYEFIPENPYILLTPGPLSTSKGVRNAMLRDWCTWDADYNEAIVQTIRRRLAALATARAEDYTAVLMQGSGSFGVEAVLGTALPRRGGKLLVLTNGAYGQRMATMAQTLDLPHVALPLPETEAPAAAMLEETLAVDPGITHVAFVHCETTTGILNPLEELAAAAKRRGKTVIVDAMSSFGGIPMDVGALGIDFLISSSNKCIQGVPGFSFVIAKRDALSQCGGNARSHSLDLYDQWREMDATGKWRFTSPTHVVRAFFQALDELEAEGGIAARHARYCENHRVLTRGMAVLGYQTLLPAALQSPIITSFLYPAAGFDFAAFYQYCKQRGFVLYPGKISRAPTFRVGHIGEVYPADMRALLEVVRGYPTAEG